MAEEPKDPSQETPAVARRSSLPRTIALIGSIVLFGLRLLTCAARQQQEQSKEIGASLVDHLAHSPEGRCGVDCEVALNGPDAAPSDVGRCRATCIDALTKSPDMDFAANMQRCRSSCTMYTMMKAALAARGADGGARAADARRADASNEADDPAARADVLATRAACVDRCIGQLATTGSFQPFDSDD